MKQEAGIRHYWKVLQASLPLLLLVSAGITLIAYLIVKNIEPTHQVHFSYLVSLSEREEAPEYRFDGFYALQATDLFAATLARWVGTPEVIVAAYERAGLMLPTDNPRTLTRTVRAEKTAPQLVQVTVQGASPQEGEQLAQGLKAVMEENVEQYHDQGIPALAFRVVATDPWTGVSRLSVPVITVATFVFVFFIGLNGVLLMESVKKSEE